MVATKKQCRGATEWTKNLCCRRFLSPSSLNMRLQAKFPIQKTQKKNFKKKQIQKTNDGNPMDVRVLALLPLLQPYCMGLWLVQSSCSVHKWWHRTFMSTTKRCVQRVSLTLALWTTTSSCISVQVATLSIPSTIYS